MKDRKQPPAKSFPTCWEIPYSAEGEDFVFTFSSDGTGKCQDVISESDVSFRWNATDVQNLRGGEAEIALHNLTPELFWSEINDQLGDDGVITEDYLSEHSEGRDVEFTCGSREELRRLTRLILYSFPCIWSDGSAHRTVSFTAKGEVTGEEAGIEDDQYFLDLGADLSPGDRKSAVELLNFAIDQNTPVGEYLAYNDGPNSRRSGYSWSVKHEDVIVERPSFHEIAEARLRLRQVLGASLSTMDLDRLLPVN